MKEGNKKWEEEFRAIFGIKVRPNNQEDETKAFLLEKFWQEHTIGEMVDFISQVEQSAYDKAIEIVEGVKEECQVCDNKEKHSTPRNDVIDDAISEITKLKNK